MTYLIGQKSRYFSGDVIRYKYLISYIIHPSWPPFAVLGHWLSYPLRGLQTFEPRLSCVVLGRLGRWSIRRGVAPGHTTIDDEISAANEAALIAGEEEDTLGLLDSLTEATSREMDFAAVTLGCVVAEPILQKWCAVTVSIPLAACCTQA